jgi:benzoyl-CoA reductase subunit C
MEPDFYDAYNKRHELAEGWKQAGKKIIGYFCNYTPEELIYAAGMIPVRIRGSSENIALADAHLPTFCCSFVRSCLDQALRGRYSYLDGVVFPKTCDMTRCLPSIWKRNMKPSYFRFIAVPGMSSDEAVDFFTKELAFFKESLEDYSGNKIDNETLNKSIKVYNENRSLMQEVNKLALADKPPLTGSEVFAIMLAGLVLPKDEHSAMLRKLLDNLPSTRKGVNGGVRLMIAGNTFENMELMQAIEECGGEVVIDDLDIGTRYYWNHIEEGAEPIKALAAGYLRRIPCPCKHPAQPRLENMLKLANEYRVKGVILINQKYCDTHLYDRPWIESNLQQAGFPVLLVEHSDIGWAGGKFKTMVRAFIEMLE